MTGVDRRERMNRLLSEQEQAGLIWELSATIEGSEGRQPTQQEIHEYLLKAQDAKTAHLVAQEIIDKLHALWCDIDRCARNSNSIEWTDGMDDANYELQCVITELEAIKSKWGIE